MSSPPLWFFFFLTVRLLHVRARACESARVDAVLFVCECVLCV